MESEMLRWTDVSGPSWNNLQRMNKDKLRGPATQIRVKKVVSCCEEETVDLCRCGSSRPP